MRPEQLEVRVGLASERGRRESNDDCVAMRESAIGDQAARTLVAVLADGVSGAGGRVAAETVVQGFLDGFLSESPVRGVDAVGARVLAALNRWVYAQGQQDTLRRGMATTFTGLILRDRRAHTLHVGDSRAYRLRDDAFMRLTRDHTHHHPDLQHVLIRAVGLEEELRADYAVHDLKPHDRFLLCSDGVHALLNDRRIQALLAERAAPEDTAQRIVAAALDQGSQDNVSALVLDVLSIPDAERLDIAASVAGLPILELPRPGEQVDGFTLREIVSDGRYSRLFRALDGETGRELVIKFPHPRVASDAVYRRAFVREAWVALQVRSPYVGEVVELASGRRTRLYSVMPYYAGETLERRLKRSLPVSLDAGVAIGIELSKAVYALNRRNIIHRDVKPDNVILLTGGGLKLVDLGVAHLPGLDRTTDDEIPGTPSYMAPELFNGSVGDAQSDVYAVGVTLYRMFTGHYPYGEVEAFSRPRFAKHTPLEHYRADLPAWLDGLLARATALDPAARPGDAMELAIELEQNLAHGPRVVARRLSLYERDPLRFWKILSLLLLLILALTLATR